VRSRCSVLQVCVLPRASLLDQCERAAELPNPIFYEAKYQNRPYHDFDETGEGDLHSAMRREALRSRVL
jgi:hypothetical protein